MRNVELFIDRNIFNRLIMWNENWNLNSSSKRMDVRAVGICNCFCILSLRVFKENQVIGSSFLILNISLILLKLIDTIVVATFMVAPMDKME